MVYENEAAAAPLTLTDYPLIGVLRIIPFESQPSPAQPIMLRIELERRTKVDSVKPPSDDPRPKDTKEDILGAFVLFAIKVVPVDLCEGVCLYPQCDNFNFT